MNKLLISSAQLLFLSKFLKPRDIDGSGWIGGQPRERWREVLGESPLQTFQRYYSNSLIEEGLLVERILHKFKVPDLKMMLMQQGLPVSGRKIELATRLIQHDLEGANNLVAGLTIYQCTKQGSQIAEEYLTREKTRRDESEKATWKALSNHEYEHASRLVAKYEADQVFPRGMSFGGSAGMRYFWENYDHSRDVRLLTTIFTGQPKALKALNLDINQLKQCRIAAGMNHLWPEWNGRTSFNNTNSPLWKATQILRAFAEYCEVKNRLYERGVKFVSIVGFASKSACCPHCRELAERRYKIDEVPELPHEKCSYKFGCRCSLQEVRMGAEELL